MAQNIKRRSVGGGYAKLTVYVERSGGRWEARYYAQDNGYAGTVRKYAGDGVEAFRLACEYAGYHPRDCKMIMVQ